MTLERLQQKIAEAERQIAVSREQFPLLMEHFNKLNAYFVYYYPHEAKIIAGVATRADFVPIRALHKGVWEKTINEEEGYVCYDAYIDGVHVHVNVHEFPPSCRIVEEVVHVPAHDETRRTVVCNGFMEAAV